MLPPPTAAIRRLVLTVGIALLATLFWTGCARSQSYPTHGHHPVLVDTPRGKALAEAALVSEVIARATLIPDSRKANAVYGGMDYRGIPRYWPILEFEFSVAEYLKGAGGSRMTVLVVDKRAAWRGRDALDVAHGWSDAHNTRWDDREAIIFADSSPYFPDTGESYFLRYVSEYYNYDLEYTMADTRLAPEYTIDTPFKVWLPSSAEDASRFMLDPPGTPDTGASAQPRTMSIADLKALIAEASEWAARFDDPEYQECVISGFDANADVEYFRIEADDTFEYEPRIYGESTSDMPARRTVSDCP